MFFPARLPRLLTPSYPTHKLSPMEVHLTPDQENFVRRAIESGRFRAPQEPMQEALALWEVRERRRAELIASLDEAEASLARGEGFVITQESMRALAEHTKQRGQSRLPSQPSTRR